MTFRRLKFVGMLAGLALSALVSAYSQQQPHRRAQSIIFSEPNRDTASSNLSQIVKQNSTHRSLEEELKKPLDLFDVTEGNAGKVAPLRQLPPPNLNSKKLKELLEKKQKQKDWVFETPEDAGSELTPEEMFKISEFGSDGQSKEKKLTPLERFYERLERQPAGRTNRTDGDELFLAEKNPDGRDEHDSLSTEKKRQPAAKTATPTFKPWLGDDSGSKPPDDPGKTRSLSEILSVGQVESPEAIRAQAARLQEYKQLYKQLFAPPSAASPGAGVGTMTLFNRGPDMGFTPPPGLEPLSILSPRNSLSPLPTSVSAPPRPQGTPGIASGFPNLTPTPLPVEPPRAPLASPTFDPPKRKF